MASGASFIITSDHLATALKKTYKLDSILLVSFSKQMESNIIVRVFNMRNN